jgi:hypothetical protein
MDWFENATIVASNDINEEILHSLKTQVKLFLKSNVLNPININSGLLSGPLDRLVRHWHSFSYLSKTTSSRLRLQGESEKVFPFEPVHK